MNITGKNLKSIFILGVLSVLTAMLLSITIPVNRTATKQQSQEKAFLYNLKAIQFSERGIIWEATVERAFSDVKTSYLDGEKIKIYLPEENLTVLAREGMLTTKDLQIKLDGEIKIYREGVLITAPTIIKDPENGNILATGGIKVISKSYTISAREGLLRTDGSLEARGEVNAIFNQ